jgi:hypothetical protein
MANKDDVVERLSSTQTGTPLSGMPTTLSGWASS